MFNLNFNHMKKMFVLIAFLFSVVCFASPPPFENNVVHVYQVQTFDSSVNSVFELNFVFDATIEPVREVTFTVIGNDLLFQDALLSSKEKLPDVMVQKYFGENSFYKPPSINTAKCGFEINYQNSNYGYPLTADNC